MSDLFGNHIVGFSTRRLNFLYDFSKNVFLYCSEVTEVLIKASKKYKHLVPYIVSFAIILSQK